MKLTEKNDFKGLLTEDQCKKILTRWAKTRDASLCSFSIEPLTNQLDGLIGEQYFLKIVYNHSNKSEEIKFFLKVLSKDNSLMFRIAGELMAFEKENFFYDIYIPTLKSLGFTCDYVAQSYLCESYTIVLEDLSKIYRNSDKNTPLNIIHCLVCLKILAKFHGDGILFQLIKSKEMSKKYTFKDEFNQILAETIQNKNNLLIENYFSASIKGLIDIARLLPQNGNKVDDFFVALQKQMDVDLDKLYKNFNTTITHNDLWSNNFLHEYNEDDTIKSSKIIDFQTISIKPPAFDVIAFIFLNTRKKIRDENLNEFITYYYNCLEKHVSEKGFDINSFLTKKEFLESCEVVKIPAKIHATIDRSTTLMSDEFFIQAMQSEENFANCMLHDRPKHMLDSFNNIDNYRDIMTEDICELNTLLLER